MKPRNREITIFNLSMMDVISGAMGAFLILVVILSRHYHMDPITTETIISLQRELVEATGHLDEASSEIHAGSSESEDIVRFLRQAKSNVNAGKAYIGQLKNELDAADARIRRLEEEMAVLEERIVDLEAELDRRRPYFVKAHWTCNKSGDVDIYLHSSARSSTGKLMPPYRPHTEQGRFYSDELYSDAAGSSGAEVWLAEVSTVGNRMKLYYGLAGEGRPKCSVHGYVYSNHFKRIELPRLMLDAKQPWVYVGRLSVRDDLKLGFTEATAQERNQEYRALGQGGSGQ